MWIDSGTIRIRCRVRLKEYFGKMRTGTMQGVDKAYGQTTEAIDTCCCRLGDVCGSPPAIGCSLSQSMRVSVSASVVCSPGIFRFCCSSCSIITSPCRDSGFAERKAVISFLKIRRPCSILDHTAAVSHQTTLMYV